jgi:hypothetical protein
MFGSFAVFTALSRVAHARFFISDPRRIENTPVRRETIRTSQPGQQHQGGGSSSNEKPCLLKLNHRYEPAFPQGQVLA